MELKVLAFFLMLYFFLERVQLRKCALCDVTKSTDPSRITLKVSSVAPSQVLALFQSLEKRFA